VVVPHVLRHGPEVLLVRLLPLVHVVHLQDLQVDTAPAATTDAAGGAELHGVLEGLGPERVSLAPPPEVDGHQGNHGQGEQDGQQRAHDRRPRGAHGLRGFHVEVVGGGEEDQRLRQLTGAVLISGLDDDFVPGVGSQTS